MTPMVRGPTPINILLVEDDPSDVDLTRRALQRAKLQNRVWIVGDGVDALAFLRREGPHRGVPRPDLVLLDLLLPNLDGRDVLMRIREEPRWQALPVVVLTASDDEHEQLAAHAARGLPIDALPGPPHRARCPIRDTTHRGAADSAARLPVDGPTAPRTIGREIRLSPPSFRRSRTLILHILHAQCGGPFRTPSSVGDGASRWRQSDGSAPPCILCSSVRVHIIAEERRQNGAFRAGVGDATVVSASRAAMSHDASEEFRRCLRERVRLARELAALRAGFATVAEHYERVLRSLQALGVELGITPQVIGHATDPDWGPATLLVYGDERFLKHEQAVIDLLLRKLP